MVALVGSYNVWIVVISLIIAFYTSYQALGLFNRISMLSGNIALGRIFIASLVLGCGIWTMHFAGMLALQLPLMIDYEIKRPLFSVLISITASCVAFYLLGTRLHQQLRVVLSSICLTAGIIMMHALSMHAMENEFITISYNSVLVIFTALTTFLASYGAFSMFAKIKTLDHEFKLRSLSALLLSGAIMVAHYMGIKAITFWSKDPAFVSGEYLTTIPKELIQALYSTIGVIVLLTWVIQVWEQRMYKKMAYTDSLTELNNRHAMNEIFKSPSLFEKKIAIMFIDLDQFKFINDTLGHDVGDLLIQEVGARIKKHVGTTQQVFRMGGDEFMIMMTYEQKADVLRAAEHLLQDIRKQFHINNHHLEVTGSIGISYSEEHEYSRDRMLKAADTAMYQAKSLGKNQFCEYTQEMEQKLMRRMDVEKGLREALIKEKIQLYYQPKWDLSLNQPIGFEALLRFNHPVLGNVPPDEFIPIAEETGLIIPMTEWVLQQACCECYEWNQEYQHELTVSVNLSIRVIDSSMLQHMVQRALALSGLAPELLELEITEQTLINCGPAINEELSPLQQLGVKLSMDNFGSGYSFLGSVERLQFQTIKIDRGYIENYDLPTKRAIVNSVINLATQLNVQLVAEGVETEPQLNLMKEAGCNVIQGFYFQKPMPSHEVEHWLTGLSKDEVSEA